MLRNYLSGKESPLRIMAGCRKDGAYLRLPGFSISFPRVFRQLVPDFSEMTPRLEMG